VFSVLSRIGTIDDALTDAAANVRAASRNIAALLKIAFTISDQELRNNCVSQGLGST